MRIYKKAKTRGGKNYDDRDVKRREEQNFFNSDSDSDTDSDDDELPLYQEEPEPDSRPRVLPRKQDLIAMQSAQLPVAPALASVAPVLTAAVAPVLTVAVAPAVPQQRVRPPPPFPLIRTESTYHVNPNAHQGPLRPFQPQGPPRPPAPSRGGKTKSKRRAHKKTSKRISASKKSRTRKSKKHNKRK